MKGVTMVNLFPYKFLYSSNVITDQFFAFTFF